MTDSQTHAAVGGTLAQIASALERLTLEPTADALLAATAREAAQLLGGHSAVVSRKDGETIREVAAATPDGPASSMIGVAGFVGPAFLVEIEVDALLAEDAPTAGC